MKPNLEICRKCERAYTHETPESVHYYCMKNDLVPDNSKPMGTIYKDGQIYLKRFQIPEDCPYTLEHLVSERKHATANAMARTATKNVMERLGASCTKADSRHWVASKGNRMQDLWKVCSSLWEVLFTFLRRKRSMVVWFLLCRLQILPRCNARTGAILKPNIKVCEHCTRLHPTPIMPTGRKYFFCKADADAAQSAVIMCSLINGKFEFKSEFSVPSNCAFMLEHTVSEEQK